MRSRGALLAAVLGVLALGCRERIELDPRGDAQSCVAEDARCELGPCCEGDCVEGTCRTDPGPCRAAGQLCGEAATCCSGLCAEGRCERLSGCAPAGEACASDEACCSRACAGAEPVCQPLGGCRPSGELCEVDGQCCSTRCVTDLASGVGRCADSGDCPVAGEVCRVASDARLDRECCSGVSGIPAACRPSELAGVDRCALQPGSCIADGEPCASPEDCCGGICALEGSAGLRCRSVCSPPGIACTRDDDCCAGRCSADGRCSFRLP